MEYQEDVIKHYDRLLEEIEKAQEQDKKFDGWSIIEALEEVCYAFILEDEVMTPAETFEFGLSLDKDKVKGCVSIEGLETIYFTQTEEEILKQLNLISNTETFIKE